jgi:hypothetical protein
VNAFALAFEGRIRGSGDGHVRPSSDGPERLDRPAWSTRQADREASLVGDVAAPIPSMWRLRHPSAPAGVVVVV